MCIDAEDITCTLVTTRALEEFHWFQYLVHEREEQIHRAHDHTTHRLKRKNFDKNRC